MSHLEQSKSSKRDAENGWDGNSIPSLNPQTGDKSSIIKRVSQGEDKMWKVSSYKKRKLVLEVNDFIECCAVEHVHFSIEELDKIIDEYSKKYPHPRYELKILEILDLEWEELNNEDNSY